jgi:parvulin-like peptidyl-prolyl isomerase
MTGLRPALRLSRLRAVVAEFGSWSAHPTRSLLIFAAGAVIGLGVAGFGLFTAKGAATRVVPPEDVALVNQRPILLSDFNAQLEAQYAVPLTQITPAERRATLNDMIREELFVQRGLELDMPSSDPDVRSALVAAVEQQVAANVTAQKLTEAQLRAYYDAHRDKYASEGTLTLHDLVLTPGGRSADQTLAVCHDAAAALARGEALATVMSRTGLKESGKVNGEEFYFAARIHLGEALFDVARRLADGAVSAPVVQPDGVHLIVMIHNIPPVPQPFADAEPRVELDQAKETRDRVTAGELEYLKEKADILITPRLR